MWDHDKPIRSLGMVLHPQRRIAGPVQDILAWAGRHQVTVLGLESELARLSCQAIPVSESEMGARADMLAALGGDGTVLRAMHLAGERAVPVLGVNLGKLGFMAEVDVPDLAS